MIYRNAESRNDGMGRTKQLTAKRNVLLLRQSAERA